MKALLALPLLFALALAGCASGPATPNQDADGNYVIEMTASNKFAPANAKVPVGATVVWSHAGGAGHDVQADGGSFTSGGTGGLMAGDSFNHTFEASGTFTYFCRNHASTGMKGTLHVE